MANRRAPSPSPRAVPPRPRRSRPGRAEPGGDADPTRRTISDRQQLVLRDRGSSGARRTAGYGLVPEGRRSELPGRAISKANPRLRPLHLVVRETEFCGLRLAGYFRRRMRENSRNSVRRPRCASLTRRNYGGFCLPGNRPGLSGLDGGGRSPQEPVCGGRILPKMPVCG